MPPLSSKQTCLICQSILVISQTCYWKQYIDCSPMHLRQHQEMAKYTMKSMSVQLASNYSKFRKLMCTPKTSIHHTLGMN